jgi:hypothetical protein
MRRGLRARQLTYVTLHTERFGRFVSPKPHRSDYYRPERKLPGATACHSKNTPFYGTPHPSESHSRRDANWVRSLVRPQSTPGADGERQLRSGLARESS